MSLIGGAKLLPNPVIDRYGKAAVRASLLHFLLGKGFNAILSLLILVLLARWTEPSVYGAYIAFLALQVTLLAVSGLGIETTTERFIPELRVHHTDKDLVGFVAAALAARLGTLLLLAFVGALASVPLMRLVGLAEHTNEFRIWLAVISVNGIFLFTVIIFESMLHQRLAQLCMGLYLLVKLVAIVVCYRTMTLDLAVLVVIELMAIGAAIVASCWQLSKLFPPVGWGRGWRLIIENRRRLTRFALFNYVAQVVFQLFNAEVMKLLVTRLLGVLQSARYGFAQMLADTVQRYLPAVLLLRLIKPVFVSRYTLSRDFEQLNAMARLILKLNLLVLAPAIAFSAVYGGKLLALLSNGKYADGHWIFVGLLALLVPASHQLVLSLLAGTLEKNAMQLYAGLVSVIGMPFAILLLPQWGPLGAVAASAVSALTYNVAATVYLRRSGFAYKPDLRAIVLFVAAGGLTFAIATVVNSWFPGPTGFMLSLGVATATYVAFVRWVRVFSQAERVLLNSLLPRPVFFF